MKLSGHTKLAPAEQDPTYLAEQRAKLDEAFAVLERVLAGKDYLLGTFSAG